MIQIPQSTSRIVLLKLYTTGTTTAATGKTLAITISKNGGAFGNPSAGATNATELSSGWYYFTLSTTDTNTLGDLVILGTATGCDASERVFAVVKATNAGLTGIPDAAPGAANGLWILGTNNGAVTLSDNFTFGSLVTYSGQVTHSNTINYSNLNYNGAVVYSSSVGYGDISVGGTVTLNHLTITGITTLQGQVILQSTLDVTGNVQFQGDVSALGLWPLSTRIPTALSGSGYMQVMVKTWDQGGGGEVGVGSAPYPSVNAASMTAGTITTASIANGAITDAKFTAPAEAAGRPTGVLGMIRRIFEKLSNKKTRNRSTGVESLRNHADTADLVTRTQSTTGSVDSITEDS